MAGMPSPYARGRRPGIGRHPHPQASLRSVGVFANRLLLWGIAFELVLAAALIYLPPFQSLLATTGLSPVDLVFTAPYPFIVWGADELRRWLIRRRAR